MTTTPELSRRRRSGVAGPRASIVILLVVVALCALAPLPFGLAFVLTLLTALGLPALPPIVRRIAIVGSAVLVAAGVVIAIWG